MKILMINTEKTWRGGERQTLYTLEGLKKRNVDVEILCRKDCPLESAAEKSGIKAQAFSSQFQILSFLIKNGKNYNLIHAQSARGQSQAVLTKIFHKRKVLYTRRVDFKINGFFSRLKYKKTDKVIAISNAIRDILADSNINDIEVIPSAVYVNESESNIEIKGIDKDKLKDFIQIGTVAALVPHKDPLTMVQAIKKLSEKRQDFKFIHFGDGELRPEVEEKIKKLGLEDIYLLQGHVDGVEAYIPNFSVFVMSSQEEGLGSTVLDAFTRKVPVVSTDAGGLKETVSGRGLLCSVGDYEELAENIDLMLNDKKTAEKFVEDAYKDVREFYSVDTMVRLYIEVYERMLNTKIPH